MTQSKAAPDNSQKWTSISSVNGPPPAGIPSAKWHRLQERTLQIGLDQESRYSRFHRQQATFANIGNYFTDFSNRNSVFRGVNPGFLNCSLPWEFPVMFVYSNLTGVVFTPHFLPK
jgi:hypothetical protein